MRNLWFPVFLVLSAAPAFAGSPRAEFTETDYDFGLLVQGTTVQHSFAFRNAGRGPLEIQSVNTSCGCTAALASDKVVPPGAGSRVDVVYDSRGKLGDLSKDVRVWTSDPGHRMVLLRIRGKVVPSDHPALTGTENLFQGSCASCHATAPAAGKKGEALYNAACAMCHEREKRDGMRLAPPAEEMSSLPRKGLVEIVSDGKGGASMPAFSALKGGPLDRRQVESVVDFIKSSKNNEQGVVRMRYFWKGVLIMAIVSSVAGVSSAENWKDQAGTYAVFDTSLGKIVCRLFADKTPKTVDNFTGLAEGHQGVQGPGRRAPK